MQSVKRILTAFALLAASCTPGAVSTDDTGAALTASTSTCNQSICDTVCVNGKAMKATLTAYLACFHFLNCSCSGNPNPPPNPPPAPSYGGSTATGGATSTGGSVSGGSGGKSATGGTSASTIAFLDCNPPQAIGHHERPHRLLSGWHRSPDRAKHRRLTVSYSIVAPSSFPKANVAINLNQANLGSCTGNGTAQCLSTWPFTGKLTEANAVAIYSLATKLDPFLGTYPPTDTGSDGASAAKAAKQLGFTALDFAAVDTVEGAMVALQKSSCIIGTDWTDHDSSPTSCGEMTDGGTVEGGHEPQLAFWDAELKRFGIRNSWLGWGNKRTGTNDTGYAYWSVGTLQKKLAAGAEIDCPVL